MLADAAGTLTTRDNLASCLGESGQLEAAVAECGALLTDGGAGARATLRGALTTRGNVALRLADSAQAGRPPSNDVSNGW